MRAGEGADWIGDGEKYSLVGLDVKTEGCLWAGFPCASGRPASSIRAPDQAED